jgi:hypothetical protein
MTVKPTQLIPNEVQQQFLLPTERVGPGMKLCYRPAFFATGSLHFSKSTMRVDHWERRSFLQIIGGDDVPQPLWSEDALVDARNYEWADEPDEDAQLLPPPSSMQTAKSYQSWQKEFKDFLYRTQNLLLFECNELDGEVSAPGQLLGDFRASLELKSREFRDIESEKLRAKYSGRFEKLRDEYDRAQSSLEREEAQYKSKRLESIFDVGGSLLGAFIGRKSRSRASSSMKSFGAASKEKADVRIAGDKLENIANERRDLDEQYAREMAELKDKVHVDRLTFNEILIPPRKTDISIERFFVAWTPYIIDDSGSGRAAF